MWKILLVAAIAFQATQSQRSFYHPRNYSKTLARFKKNETETTTNKVLATRGGEEDENSESSSALPADLQGTLEDQRFVHRVSQWPEDKQPFWFKNRWAISSMRDRNVDGGNVQSSRRLQPPASEFQTPFLGRNNVRSRTALNLSQPNENNNRYYENEITHLNRPDSRVRSHHRHSSY